MLDVRIAHKEIRMLFTRNKNPRVFGEVLRVELHGAVRQTVPGHAIGWAVPVWVSRVYWIANPQHPGAAVFRRAIRFEHHPYP